MFRKAKQRILIWNCRFSWAIFNFEKLNFEKYLTGSGFETASFFSFLVFSVIRKKIYPLSNAYKGIPSRPFPPTIRAETRPGSFSCVVIKDGKLNRNFTPGWPGFTPVNFDEIVNDIQRFCGEYNKQCKAKNVKWSHSWTQAPIIILDLICAHWDKNHLFNSFS